MNAVISHPLLLLGGLTYLQNSKATLKAMKVHATLPNLTRGGRRVFQGSHV